MSFKLATSAFSEEKQIAFLKFFPNNFLSFSFAVITATFAPAFSKASKIVDALKNVSSFIKVSLPSSGLKKKFPHIPCISGVVPVTIDMLFTFVKLGIAHLPTS